MDLRILAVILLYYSLISGFFLLGGTTLQDYSSTENLTGMDVSEETGTGGLFGTGINFGRFWLFLTFGVGLSDDVPVWMAALWFLWSTCVSIFVAGFIISSIWNG